MVQQQQTTTKPHTHKPSSRNAINKIQTTEKKKRKTYFEFGFFSSFRLFPHSFPFRSVFLFLFRAFYALFPVENQKKPVRASEKDEKKKYLNCGGLELWAAYYFLRHRIGFRCTPFWSVSKWNHKNSTRSCDWQISHNLIDLLLFALLWLSLHHYLSVNRAARKILWQNSILMAALNLPDFMLKMSNFLSMRYFFLS